MDGMNAALFTLAHPSTPPPNPFPSNHLQLNSTFLFDTGRMQPRLVVFTERTTRHDGNHLQPREAKMHDPNELQAALDQAKFLMQVACYLIPAAFAGMAWLAIWSRRDS